MATSIKDPHTCEIDECSSVGYVHVNIRFFAGEFSFVLCKYHLRASKVKPTVIEGHRVGPDCQMPGADWYRLQGDQYGHSACVCADGDEEITYSIPLGEDEESGDD